MDELTQITDAVMSLGDDDRARVLCHLDGPPRPSREDERTFEPLLTRGQGGTPAVRVTVRRVPAQQS